MSHRTSILVAWLVVALGFCIALTVLQPSDAEVCSLGGGEWDAGMERCFRYW